MSLDESSSRKAKKAQRDLERRKSGKKRKRDEIEESKDAVVQADELQQDFIPLDVGADVLQGDTVTKKSSSKKRKAVTLERNGEAEVTVTPDAIPPKPKKRKKQKGSAAENGEASEDGAAVSTKNHRFVCFIGNLPYTTTDASLQAHFKKLAPFTLRHRTDPATSKSKGFAFLEFENYDRMKTCLKLYHHSMFDPDDATGDIEVADEGAELTTKSAPKKKSKAARRINVELTAGGGGKNAARKEKIKVKNNRLGEQRTRRAEAEKEAKEHGESGKGAEKKGKKKQQQQKDQRTNPTVDAEGQDHTAGMHPSRLAMMKT